MPTRLTGAKKLAATAAWLAEPPSSRGFLLQGVLIESKAVEPTTRTLIMSFQLIARFHRRRCIRNHRCVSIRNQYVLGAASVARSCLCRIADLFDGKCRHDPPWKANDSDGSPPRIAFAFHSARKRWGPVRPTAWLSWLMLQPLKNYHRGREVIWPLQCRGGL